MSSSLLNLNELLESTGGSLVSKTSEINFTSVQTDSRAVENGTMFFPLVGEFQDGHKYIPSAIEKGASVVFIQDQNYSKDNSMYQELISKNPDVCFITVKNNMTALQNSAEKYVSKFPKLIKIAVTGSSGKTTTKEIAASVLSQKFNVITNKGNFNSETGLPLSVFNIRSEHEVGLFEMGMNRVNEIKEISQVLKAQYAVVTNIGSAHIGILGSRENIAKEKCNAFNYLGNYQNGIAFIPYGDDFLDYMTNYAEEKNAGVLYYGNPDDEKISGVKNLGLEGTEFFVGSEKCVLSLPGIYNFKNALAAVELGLALGLTEKEISTGINSMKGLFGRSEVIKGKYTVIQDCYNANPDSMEKSLEFFGSIPVSAGQKKIIVIGDMKELGSDSVNAHRNAGIQAKAAGADFVFFAGPEIKEGFESFGDSSKSAYYESSSENELLKIAEKINSLCKGGDIVLIKASRSMGLEKLTSILMQESK